MGKSDKICYTQFKNQLQESFQEKYREAKVDIRRVLKNNTVYLDGLSILMPGENLSPTIYLNEYYGQYLADLSFEETVGRIEQVYLENRKDTCIDVEFFKNFDQVKNRLVFKLINYEKNKELLQLIPHRKFLDFAIIYYCMILDDKIGSATITVYYSHMELWGVDEKTVFETAKVNTPKLLPCILMEMTEIIDSISQDSKIQETESLFGEDSIEACFLDHENFSNYPRMFVLTNKNRTFGAITMLYPNILRCFADKVKSDLFILPSSIHEIILISKKELSRLISLEDMVREVNDEQVQEEEILSYQVYEYDSINNQIKIGVNAEKVFSM